MTERKTHKSSMKYSTCVISNHPTAECMKPVSTPARCINCAQVHPANYKGCFVAKQLPKGEKKRNKVRNLQSHLNLTSYDKEYLTQAQ